MEERHFPVNDDTIQEFKSLLQNEYKDFEVWVSSNLETIKIKSLTNPGLPILVIGFFISQ